MKKRGISPLIATVLIIGFTVILGGFVFLWGGNLFTAQKEKTSQEASVNLECAKIVISVKEACFVGQDVYMLIENVGQQDISSFLTRLSGNKGKAVNGTGESLSVYSKKIIKPGFDEIGEGLAERIGIPKSIELFPKVLYNNELHTCDYSTEKEIKSCVEALELESCDEFKDEDGDSFEEGIDCFTGSKESLGLVTDMETPNKVLSIQNINIDHPEDTNPKSITAISKEFIIPDDTKLFHPIGILLSSENYGTSGTVTYILEVYNKEGIREKEINFGNDKLLTETQFSSSFNSIKLDENGLKGKMARLKIVFNGIGRAAIFRFCYYDDSELCII